MFESASEANMIKWWYAFLFCLSVAVVLGKCWCFCNPAANIIPSLSLSPSLSFCHLRWPLAPRATHLQRDEKTRYRVKRLFFALTKSWFSHSPSQSLIQSVGALMPRLFHNQQFISSALLLSDFSQDNCCLFLKGSLYFLVIWNIFLQLSALFENPHRRAHSPQLSNSFFAGETMNFSP